MSRKFEYRTLWKESILSMSELDDYGEQGWEVCSYHNDGSDVNQHNYILKREILDSKVGDIQKVINEYYLALDTRQHGGVAQDRAFNKIQQILGMNWSRGEQLRLKGD